MENTLQEEIEYVHSNRLEFESLARDYEIMYKIVCSATNTYTNLSLFWNDISCMAMSKGLMTHSSTIRQLNDLYLVALLHINEEEYQRIKKENE